MDLVNRAIQYDRRNTEKPFLLNRHTLLVWPPSFNAAAMPLRGNAAVQHAVVLTSDSDQLPV
jgi:hypothetical protein